MLFSNRKCSNCECYYDPTLNQCPECHKDNELRSRRGFFDNIVSLSPIAQMGIFLIGFAYAGMLIVEIIFGLVLSDISNPILRETLAILFVYIAMLGGIMSIVLTTRRKLFFDSFKKPLDYAFGAAYFVAAIITSIIVSAIVNIFYSGGSNDNQNAAIDIVNNYPIIAFFILCFLGPVTEEMTYRVGLFSFLKRINIVLAFVLSAFVFAFIHFNPASDDLISELWALPSYIVPGVILAFAYYHRGPACAMTAHILYNLLSYIMILLVK